MKFCNKYQYLVIQILPHFLYESDLAFLALCKYSLKELIELHMHTPCTHVHMHTLILTQTSGEHQICKTNLGKST